MNRLGTALILSLLASSAFAGEMAAFLVHTFGIPVP